MSPSLQLQQTITGQAFSVREFSSAIPHTVVVELARVHAARFPGMPSSPSESEQQALSTSAALSALGEEVLGRFEEWIERKRCSDAMVSFRSFSHRLQEELAAKNVARNRLGTYRTAFEGAVAQGAVDSFSAMQHMLTIGAVTSSLAGRLTYHELKGVADELEQARAAEGFMKKCMESMGRTSDGVAEIGLKFRR